MLTNIKAFPKGTDKPLLFDINAALCVVGQLSRLWEDTLNVGYHTGCDYSSGRSIRGKIHQHTFSYGYKVLGAGLFSIVLHSELFPNTVIKFSNRDDDAYFHYALWCRANPNPHAPKILHIEKLAGVGYFVVMPKYEPWVEPEVSMALNIREWAENIAYFPDREDRPRCVAKYPPSLGRFARELGNYFDRICPLDMHEENVMWDNGVLIITDPVSYTSRRNTNEERNKRAALEEQILPTQQALAQAA